MRLQIAVLRVHACPNLVFRAMSRFTRSLCPALISIPDLLGDVIASLRVYRQGLAVVKALHLPDVHFHAEVRKQIDYLYAQVGDIETVAPDSAWA